MNKKPARFDITVPTGYHRKSLPFFQEWLDALESGNFRQVTGTLCSPNGKKSLGYCCLGVLSRIQGRLIKDREEKEWYDQSPLIDKKLALDAHRECANLHTDNPSYKALNSNGKFPKGVKLVMKDNGTELSDLIGCNDTGKLTFKEIAQVIRRIWKA